MLVDKNIQKSSLIEEFHTDWIHIKLWEKNWLLYEHLKAKN